MPVVRFGNHGNLSHRAAEAEDQAWWQISRRSVCLAYSLYSAHICCLRLSLIELAAACTTLALLGVVSWWCCTERDFAELPLRLSLLLDCLAQVPVLPLQAQ